MDRNNCVYFNEHQKTPILSHLKNICFVFVAEFSARESKAQRMVSAKMI